MVLSKQFRAAIKLSPVRQYELAQAIGVHPGTLSSWLNGAYEVHPDDSRLLKLARLVGVAPDQAFADRDPARLSAIELRCHR